LINALSSSRRSAEASAQASTLLPRLFERADEDQRLTVLNIGPALPETVTFFSGFRCRLYFADLFSELPLEVPEDMAGSPGDYLEQAFREALALPAGTTIDICLFWDLFNFLDADALTALLNVLRPHLHGGSAAHGFSVHNTRTPQGGYLYGINSIDELNLRRRREPLPGYAPHSQSQLKALLRGLRVERSLLLPDSRLELLLHTVS
jgi:hypothetical protein